MLLFPLLLKFWSNTLRYHVKPLSQIRYKLKLATCKRFYRNRNKSYKLKGNGRRHVSCLPIRGASSQQAADTVDWTVRCDWLQVANSRKFSQDLRKSYRTSCKFYRCCDSGLTPRFNRDMERRYRGVLRPCGWKTACRICVDGFRPHRIIIVRRVTVRGLLRLLTNDAIGITEQKSEP